MEQVRNEKRGRRNLRGDGNEITDAAQGDKPKKGRPKNDESKKFTRSINLKLTEDYFEAIAQKAADIGMKPTQYARQMTLNGSIKSRYTKEELDLRRKIAGMANNLNQIARKANADGLDNVGWALVDLWEDLKKLLDDR